MRISIHMILLVVAAAMLGGCATVPAEVHYQALDLIQSGTDTTWTDSSKTNVNFLLQVKKRDGMTLKGVTLIEKWPGMHTRTITADRATLYAVAYGDLELAPPDGTGYHTNLVSVYLHGGKDSDSGGGIGDFSFTLRK